MQMSHAASSGPKSRPRGKSMPRKRRPASASTSRFCTRYAAPKIVSRIFGAAYLVQKRDVLALAGRRFLGIDFPRGRDFGPLLAAWLICIGVLVRGHDLGTSLLFFGLFVVLLYVATER